ncbi:hypothetical protein RUND412_011340 [Rhizina undulata]
MSLKRNRTAFEKETRPTSLVIYGTALPPLDSEARDDGSYVPIWNQEVTDERGRKRLHGAFTGGFSAGIFPEQSKVLIASCVRRNFALENRPVLFLPSMPTVGAIFQYRWIKGRHLTGWTPTTFKSSRSARTKLAQARPEDFMDEEDLLEAAEAQKIETNQGFSELGSTEEEIARRGRPPTLMDLLMPAVQDTTGVKLLKKMGWKEGQGIGPKVRRKAIASDEGDVDNNDETTYLFAPTNSVLVTYHKRNHFKGLGYVDEASLSLPSERKQSPDSLRGKKKLPQHRGGIGVGVLNDDEEEEDIYEIRPKASYNSVIGGDKKKKPAKAQGVPKPVVAKHVYVSRKAIVSKSRQNSRQCHDGRLPLDGFILSSEPLQSEDGIYTPPEIPADWVPVGAEASPQSKVQDAVEGSTAELKLDARARGEILGETPLSGKSVFDYLKPAARDRIAAATGNNLPPGLGETAPAGYTPANPSSLADLVPKLDSDVAIRALRGGFMPYSDDPDKRTRYRTFLEVQAGLREGLPDRKYGMATQDWLKELNEFMGAARIFKPLTGAIANRFTSASNFQGNTNPPLHTDPDVLIHRPVPKAEDPAEVAAKMSMYGPMTRSLVQFYPTRLLCKRFNVRPPVHVDPGPMNPFSGGPGQASGAGASDLTSKAQMVDFICNVNVNPNTSYEAPDVVVDVLTVDAERNEALEGERAGDEVFKAIFGDSEEE